MHLLKQTIRKSKQNAGHFFISRLEWFYYTIEIDEQTYTYQNVSTLGNRALDNIVTLAIYFGYGNDFVCIFFDVVGRMNFNISHAGNLIEDKELFTISIVVSLMISKAMKLIF